ncbi:HRDC domain-containing protein, partial [Thermodesulfobacteriota bacterium]
LMNIVKDQPTGMQGLKKVKALSRKQIVMYGDALIKTVETALKIPATNLPTYPRKKAPLMENAVRKRIKALKSWRDAKAKQLDFDPALICNKALSLDIAQKNPGNLTEFKKIKPMKNWQRNEFNKDILSVLRKADGRKY